MSIQEINDYFFYKIVNDDNEWCYVGSTHNWKQRENYHKNTCNNENHIYHNIKVYQIIRANGGWKEFKMIEIGTAEQLTTRQAEEIEEEYRIELKANMNGKRCFRSKEEKQEYQKEYHKEHGKIYRINNADKIKEDKKQYYIKNTDKHNQYSKQYYIKNADKIKAYGNEKHTCECGGNYTKVNVSHHNKTKLHQAYILNNPIKTDVCIECK